MYAGHHGKAPARNYARPGKYLISVHCTHSVWKSQKMSHTILQAKRAMFTFWVDKS